MLEQTFCGINFAICVLVLCICIMILISRDKLLRIRLSRENVKYKPGENFLLYGNTVYTHGLFYWWLALHILYLMKNVCISVVSIIWNTPLHCHCWIDGWWHLPSQVVYFPQGHQLYIEGIRNDKVYSLRGFKAPWHVHDMKVSTCTNITVEPR